MDSETVEEAEDREDKETAESESEAPALAGDAASFLIDTGPGEAQDCSPTAPSGTGELGHGAAEVY